MRTFFLLGIFVAFGVYHTEACTYLGKDHAMGDVWTAADGCNQCVCGIVGSICTKKMCVDTPIPTQSKTTDKPATSNPAVATTTTYDPTPAPLPCVVIATDGTQLTYKDGQSFRSPDGCNTCMCGNGRALCTLMACIKKECTDASTGKTYAVGVTFPSSDGCNTCQCFDGGISCTKMLCRDTTPRPAANVCIDSSGAIHADGETYKATDGCNTCTCADGMAACTEMACMKTGQCFDKYTIHLYEDGDKFRAPDGCNSCSCTSGVISCTKTIC